MAVSCLIYECLDDYRPRIYYAWLRCWGIPTSIDRPTPSEIGPLSPQHRDFNEAVGLMAVDEERQLDVIRNRSTWVTQTPDLVASSNNNFMLQPGSQGDDDIRSISARDGSCSSSNDERQQNPRLRPGHRVATGNNNATRRPSLPASSLLLKGKCCIPITDV